MANITYGSEYVYNSASTRAVSCVALDSTHVVTAYKDEGNSNYGTACVGVISGTTITWGSEYTFETGSSVSETFIDVIDSTHFIICYRKDTGTDVNCIIGTVASGDVISYGSAYTAYGDGHTVGVKMLGSSNFVVSYNNATFNRQELKYGTITSVDNISYGSAVVADSYTGGGRHSFAEIDSTNFVAIAGDYPNLKASVCSVSGTTITMNTGVTISSDGAEGWHDSVMLDSTHFAVFMSPVISSTNRTQAVIGTVSGTTSSFGTAVDVAPSGYDRAYLKIDKLDSSTFVTIFSGVHGSYSNVGVVTSGDTITMDDSTGVKYNVTNYSYGGVAALDSSDFVVSFYDQGNSTYGTGVVGSYSPIVGPANLKTFNGVATASVKTIDGTAIASVKSINTVV